MSLLRGVGATLLAVLPLTASSVAYSAPLAPAAGQAATTTVIQPAALGAQSSQSAAGTESAAYAQTILTRVNALRSELGLAPVTRYTELDTIAQTWSEQMAGGGTMTHNPDFSGQYPTGWSWAAENVAMRGSSSNGEDIGALLFEQWRSSPGHYQNMTDPETNAIGLGIAYNSSTGSWYATQNFGTYEDVSGLTPAAPSQASAPAPAASAGLPTAAAGAEPTPESNAPAPAAGAAGSPETAEPAGNTGADESAGTGEADGIGGVAEPAEPAGAAGAAGSDESVEAADSNGFTEAAGSSGSGDVAQSGEPVGAAEPGEPNGSGDPAESAQQTGSGESGAAESAPSADSGDPAESAGTPTLEQAAPAALAEASLAPAVRVSAAEAAADAMAASSATPAAAAGQRGESGRPNGLALTGPNLAVGLTALGLVVAGLALVRRRRRA